MSFPRLPCSESPVNPPQGQGRGSGGSRAGLGTVALWRPVTKRQGHQAESGSGSGPAAPGATLRSFNLKRRQDQQSHAGLGPLALPPVDAEGGPGISKPGFVTCVPGVAWSADQEAREVGTWGLILRLCCFILLKTQAACASHSPWAGSCPSKARPAG